MPGLCSIPWGSVSLLSGILKLLPRDWRCTLGKNHSVRQCLVKAHACPGLHQTLQSNSSSPAAYLAFSPVFQETDICFLFSSCLPAIWHSSSNRKRANCPWEMLVLAIFHIFGHCGFLKAFLDFSVPIALSVFLYLCFCPSFTSDYSPGQLCSFPHR